MKLKPCPDCGCTNRIVKVRIMFPDRPRKWYIMCDNCHWCGRTKLFLRSAERAWNKDCKIFKETKEQGII